MFHFIKRIYLKCISIGDEIIYKIISSINQDNNLRYESRKTHNDIVKVEHSYPLNFDQKDARLFEEWKAYNTFENQLFELNKVNVSFEGIVFKGEKNFTQALPHPIFKKKIGLRYLLSQRLFMKKHILESNKKYLLVFDFWSNSNYYHWMIDSLSRIMVWKEQVNDFVILLPENPPKYITDTIKLFDVKEISYISKNSFVHIDSLYVANYPAWSGQQNPAVLKQLQSFILNKFPESKNVERIYVSRSKQKQRRVANETTLIDVLKQYNFEIVYFEGMSVSEQIAIVKNAKIIVTSHGANLTNTIFAKHSRVLELIREEKSNFCYWSALTCLNIPYYYQLCKVVNHDDLYVDITLFEKNLQAILKDN